MFFFKLYRFIFYSALILIASLYNNAVLAQSCVFSLGNDLQFCAPFSHTLQAPTGFSTYSWMPGGATTPSIQVNAFGTYSCTVTNSSGNLVINGNFSAGNTGFNSNYIVPAFPGPWGLVSNPGEYAINTSPNLAHNN